MCLHQSHQRIKGSAIACGRTISHRGHPSRLPYGSLRSALTEPDRDAGNSFHYQAMAGALCMGSTLSPYQRSLILLLTQTGFLMEGGNLVLHDISADGRRILYSERYNDRNSLLLFSLDGERRAELVVDQRVDNAAMSPDGAWTVYHPYTETGLYVQPLTSGGLRRQVANVGNFAVWRRDGKEILYYDRDQGAIRSVRVDGVGDQLHFAAPEPLFPVSAPLGLNSGARPLAVSHDGSRIFFLQSTEEPDSGVIQVRTGVIR